jgi:hypothetical protein
MDNILNDIKSMTPDEPFFKDISQYIFDPNDPPDELPTNKVSPHLHTIIKRYVIRDKLFYYIDKSHARLFVPKPLRHCILSLAHDHGPAIHTNWERTHERISQFYHWPNLHKDVKTYVRQCDACQRNRILRRPPYGYLGPQDVPPDSWHTISMDFVGPLPLTRQGHNFLQVIVDSGSKRVILITCHDTDSAKDVAKLFELHVWRHHGLPKRIISDRDTRFMSNFWKSLMSTLKISLNVASTSHPQTDGQTEQKNDWIIACIRNFFNHYQNDWGEYLHIVEHAINDTINLSTGYTPFYLDTGRHPTSVLDLSLNAYDRLNISDFKAVYGVVKDKIRATQDTYAAQTNKHRLEDPFKIGDLVLISTKDFLPPNLRNRPSVKLGKITSKIGTSYKLNLPPKWHVHNVFHPEKLWPYFWDTTGPHPLSLLPIAEWVIDKILAARVITTNGKRHHKQVLFQWPTSTTLVSTGLSTLSPSRPTIASTYGKPQHPDQWLAASLPFSSNVSSRKRQNPSSVESSSFNYYSTTPSTKS